LLSFLVGSSLPAFFITLGYLTHAFLRTPIHNQKQIPFHSFPFFVAAYIGIANVISTALSTRLGYPSAPLLVGASAGLLLSFIGRYALDLPRLLFEMPHGTHHRVHMAATIMYSLIFTVIIAPFTALVACT
jgi:hypothetical protein